MNQVFDPLRLSSRNGSAAKRKVECSDHAPAYCFAVQQHFVAGRLLNGMTDGVSEIQNHPQSIFALVAD